MQNALSFARKSRSTLSGIRQNKSKSFRKKNPSFEIEVENFSGSKTTPIELVEHRRLAPSRAAEDFGDGRFGGLGSLATSASTEIRSRR